RAADAGATPENLSAGDGHNKLANALALQGKTLDAGDHLNQATIQWSAAERNARAASAALAQASRTNPVDTPKPQAPAPTVAVSQVQQAAAIPQTPAPPVSNPAADIAVAVSVYARALESKDVGVVRRAYPGITPAQARGWEQFFATLRTIKVNLAINGLEVTGSTADAKLVGTYDYVTEAGKATQQAVSFQAAFRREGGVWQLASVH
ncbi:MAG: hypothetical protein ABI625_19575, partial [bacterium]